MGLVVTIHDKMTKDDKGLYICPICNKHFYTITPGDWVYKIITVGKKGKCRYEIYCSYTCYRKAKNETNKC